VRGMRRLLIAFALVGLVAGCGGHRARTTANGTSGASPTRGANAGCHLFLRGTTVEIAFDGAGTIAACPTLEQSWSGNGFFWSRNDARGSGRRSMVCYLVAPDATFTATVYVGRSVSDEKLANTSCGNFISRGFSEM
jgi:hypothetical protein